MTCINRIGAKVVHARRDLDAEDVQGTDDQGGADTQHLDLALRRFSPDLGREHRSERRRSAGRSGDERNERYPAREPAVVLVHETAGPLVGVAGHRDARGQMRVDQA